MDEWQSDTSDDYFPPRREHQLSARDDRLNFDFTDDSMNNGLVVYDVKDVGTLHLC